MWHRYCLLIVAALPGAGIAAETPRSVATAAVRGVGTVRTPPDTASLSFTVRGEGVNADAATQTLVDRQKANSAGIAGVLGGALAVQTGTVAIETARAGDCGDSDGNDQVRLSEGACRVTGYVATLTTSADTHDVARAATAAGLAARLGATDARVTGYALADDGAARRMASTRALADARTQAQSIADGAHVPLGRLISVRNEDVTSGDPGGSDIVVTATRAAAPVVAPPPIAIDLSPAPIDTTVRLDVVYAIGG